MTILPVHHQYFTAFRLTCQASKKAATTSLRGVKNNVALLRRSGYTYSIAQFLDYVKGDFVSKEKTGVMDDTIQGKNPASTRLLPVSNISIPQFLDYVKEDFVSKEKTGVMDDTALQGGERTRLLPASNYSVPQLIKLINLIERIFQVFSSCDSKFTGTK